MFFFFALADVVHLSVICQHLLQSKESEICLGPIEINHWSPAGFCGAEMHLTCIHSYYPTDPVVVFFPKVAHKCNGNNNPGEVGVPVATSAIHMVWRQCQSPLQVFHKWGTGSHSTLGMVLWEQVLRLTCFFLYLKVVSSWAIKSCCRLHVTLGHCFLLCRLLAIWSFI